jgi:hypothetical protein
MSGRPPVPHKGWLAVAVTVGCLLIGGCSAGAGGTASADSSPASQSAAAATPAGSPASTRSVPAVGANSLTGNFCTDFGNLKNHVPAIPAADKGNLSALQRDAAHLLASAASYFAALAGESPPNVASALRTIASTYQQNERVAQAQTSAASLDHVIQSTQYAGPALTALRVVATYYSSHCLG